MVDMATKLFAVILRRESRHITSFQNFLLLFDLKLRFVYAERRNKNGYRD
jgi:hypothetical protein